MRVLVTGAAGFIGAATCHRLLERGDEVVGLDDFNDYYDPSLKEARAARLEGLDRFSMVRLDCSDRPAMSSLFSEGGFERVVHLAAQAGVRHSITDPYAYVDANLSGFLTILEGCRHHDVGHLVYASSSSVYGNNRKLPFSVADPVDHPVSMYAATKKANESMAHSYAHLWELPTTMFRFFTVYGPFGRPDLALYKFVDAILDDRPIDIYNNGDMYRDFTYVGDLVRGIRMLIDAVPRRPERPDIIPDYDSLSPVAPY
ncbi:MAG: SDR family NAD(P)-dependent oxidoreductase, partial [Planctomycetota bacterium]|nr:SDR family NAD(P)-dependent oxidoreductase [Planctomycetota bacterium]